MFGLSKKALSSAVIAAFASFSFGLTLTTLSIVEKPMLDAGVDENVIKFSAAIYCIGAMISNLSIGYLKTKIKIKIIISQVFFIVGTIFLLFYFSWALIVGKLLHGLGIGIVCSIIPLYLDNLTASEHRGRILSLHQLGVVFGIFLGQGLTACHAIPGLSYGILCGYFALLAAACFYLKNVAVESVERKSPWQLIKNRKTWKSLIVSIIFHVGQQFSCINGIIIFSSPILKQYGNPDVMSMLIGFANICGTIVSILIVDYAGRKVLFVVSGIICSICLLLIALEIQVLSTTFIFIIGFSVGFGPIPWIVMREMFEEAYKAAGSEIAVGANWLSNFFVVLITGLFLSTAHFYVFLTFGASTILTTGLILLFYVETKGKPAAFLE